MSKSLSFIKRKNSCGSRRIFALLLAMLAFVCTVVFRVFGYSLRRKRADLHNAHRVRHDTAKHRDARPR